MLEAVKDGMLQLYRIGRLPNWDNRASAPSDTSWLTSSVSPI
jgi:hypothetical protein